MTNIVLDVSCEYQMIYLYLLVKKQSPYPLCSVVSEGIKKESCPWSDIFSGKLM